MIRVASELFTLAVAKTCDEANRHGAFETVATEVPAEFLRASCRSLGWPVARQGRLIHHPPVVAVINCLENDITATVSGGPADFASGRHRRRHTS